jgi:hypothetical protein
MEIEWSTSGLGHFGSGKRGQYLLKRRLGG